MIIARCDIGNDWTQHIKRCPLADCFLQLHIRLNLMKRHMSRPLDNDLYILCPCALCQFSQRNKLLNLWNIPGILQAARQ